VEYQHKLLFALSVFAIFTATSFAEEQTIEKNITHAKAKDRIYAQEQTGKLAKSKAEANSQAESKTFSRKSTGKVYSCEYKIIYSTLALQKASSNDKIAYQNLPFTYTKTVNSVYQHEENPIINPPKNLNIKVNFDLKIDKKAYNIKLTPSTDSVSLDKSIQNAFLIARFSTHKGFWWGDTLQFSDEIKLEKTDNCKIQNIYNDNIVR